MRRAALYAWNKGAIVIVDEGPDGPVIVDTIEIEDAATASPDRLAAFVTSNGVDRLLVMSAAVEPGRKPFPEAAYGLAVMLADLCPIEVVHILESARKRHGAAASKLCPRGGASMAGRDAMAMVLADMEPAAAPAPIGPVARLVAALQALPPEQPRPALAEAERLEADGQPIEGALVRVENDLPWKSTLPSGPCVAGVDPGERWIAVCVGAETGVPAAPLAYVASLVVEIERTGKDQPTDDQLDVAVGKAVDFCELHGVHRAAVERAVNVHRAPGKSAEEGAGLAAYLLRGQYVAGMLRGALRAARREGGGPLIPGKVESVSSVKGRNHVRRLAGVGIGKDSPWMPRVREAFGGTIPAGVGEHVLDAAVAAVWLVRPEEAAPAPRAPRKPGEPGQGRVGRNEAEKARKARKRAEERLAAGCKCPAGPHTDPACPIAATANAKRAASMVGNANARRAKDIP